MKNPRISLLAIALLSMAIGFSACMSLNPTTGEDEYDPVKTDAVKAAIEPPVIGAVRRIVQKNPETAKYFSRAAKTFAYMRDTKQLDPAFLLQQLDEAAKDEGWYDVSKDWVSEALDVKNSLVSLYRVFYNYRFIADLPEDQFLYHLTDFFADVISRGVTEAGNAVARKRARSLGR